MKGPFNPVEMIRAASATAAAHSAAADCATSSSSSAPGAVADYQMSAWLMAVFLRGMSDRETVALTEAMLHSGEVLRLPSVKAVKVDKHSTGGVGRQDQHLPGAAGGRLRRRRADDLRARSRSHRRHARQAGGHSRLPRRSSARTRFERVVREVGASMIGQSAELAPADRRIYALRDVTATVECIPLIVASILSKKLAEGIDGLVLDVKVGRGAFMKDLKSARALARALVRVGSAAGKRVVALLTDMDAPIGRTIGNALETREAIEILRNAGPADTRELTLTLGAEMLVLGKAERTLPSARARLERALADGSALERFPRMVEAHGGDVRVVEHPERLAQRQSQSWRCWRAARATSTECDAYALGMSGSCAGCRPHARRSSGRSARRHRAAARNAASASRAGNRSR